MSYFGKYDGNYPGSWWGADAGAAVISRTMSDALAVTDAFLLVRYLTRRLDDGAAATDGLIFEVIGGGGQVFVAVMTDTLTPTDALLRRMTLRRVLTEGVEPSDELLRRLGLVRVLSESVTPSDAIVRSAIRARLITESLAATDAAQRFLVRARALQDSVEVYDALEKARYLRRVADDMLDLADALDASVVFGLTYGTRIRIGAMSGAVLGSSTANVAVLGCEPDSIVLGGFNAL